MERPEVLFFNKEYISNGSLTIRRKSRHSPVYVNFFIEFNYPVGDNLTINLKLAEYLSGRWHPLALTYKLGLCEFLNHEVYLGTLFAKHLLTNHTCPFPKGRLIVHDLVLNVENLKLDVLFSSLSASVIKARGDIELYWSTNTKEPVAVTRVYYTFVIKPDIQKRKKSFKHTSI